MKYTEDAGVNDVELIVTAVPKPPLGRQGND